MNYQDFIKPELLVLIPVLYFIGMGVKKSNVSDRYIPLILGVISVALCILWVAANSAITEPSGWAEAIFTSITQGVLIAGASVYCNQIIKQTGKED